MRTGALHERAHAKRDSGRRRERVRVARGYSPPRASLLAHRPFAAMSLELSTGWPSNRCPGFTHGGLSQVWQAYMPGTRARPILFSSAHLWAPMTVPLRLKLPYPDRPRLAPVHGQHSSGPRRSTFSQKRSASVRHASPGSPLRLHRAQCLAHQPLAIARASQSSTAHVAVHSLMPAPWASWQVARASGPRTRSASLASCEYRSPSAPRSRRQSGTSRC